MEGRTQTSFDCDEAVKAGVLSAVLIGSAYLMTAAMQSPTLWWLGWVTLLPLFLAIRVLTPAPALAAGAIWGSSLFLFAGFSDGALLDPSLRSLLLLTVIPGIYACVGSHVTRRVGFNPLLLAVGWMGVELALQPLGLHHGLLAGTLGGEGLFVRTVGFLAGYVLVAFIIAYVTASLLSVLSDICVSAPRSLYEGGCGDIPCRLFLSDEPVFSLQLVSSAHPRAPPV